MFVPDIIFEDNHLIAVNKRSSELVQGDCTGDTTLPDSIKDWLKKKYNKPGNVFLGVIHRLDRPVSGVVLFAKTSKALTRVNNLFKEGKVTKLYWAIVSKGSFNDSGTLIHYLKKNVKQNKSYAFEYTLPDAKKAELSYRKLFDFEKYSLLEIELKTGRHHQIRCQLSKIGLPVYGDLKYGYPRSMPGGGIGLHARFISFIHPVTNLPVTITADPGGNILWDKYMKLPNSL